MLIKINHQDSIKIQNDSVEFNIALHSESKDSQLNCINEVTKQLNSILEKIKDVKYVDCSSINVRKKWKTIEKLTNNQTTKTKETCFDGFVASSFINFLIDLNEKDKIKYLYNEIFNIGVFGLNLKFTISPKTEENAERELRRSLLSGAVEKASDILNLESSNKIVPINILYHCNESDYRVCESSYKRASFNDSLNTNEELNIESFMSIIGTGNVGFKTIEDEIVVEFEI